MFSVFPTTCVTMPERLGEMFMDVWTPFFILWIALLPHVYMAPRNESNVLSNEATMELNGIIDEQKVLNRSKRGWVWNQMFVLEEFSGPEPILVGRVSSILS